MARSWQYSRSRRTLMQVIMWLVLAATVGGASLLTRQRLQSRMVHPEKAVRLLAVEVRLPAGWRAGKVHVQKFPPLIGSDRIAMTSATEYGRRSGRDEQQSPGRQLIFREEVVRDGMTTVEYLSQQGAGEVSEGAAEQLADVGGQPGWMVVVPGERSEEGRAPWSIYAGAIFPPNRAVMVQMIGRGAMVPEDREDVKRLAANIRFVGTRAPGSSPSTRPATRPGE